MLSQYTVLAALSIYPRLELILYLHNNMINENIPPLNNKLYKYRDHDCSVQHLIFSAQAAVWLSVMLDKFLIG